MMVRNLIIALIALTVNNILASVADSHDGQTGETVNHRVVLPHQQSVQIASPEQGSRFVVGEVLNLVGRSNDPSLEEDVEMTWEVRLYDNDGSYTALLDVTRGNFITVDPIPQPKNLLSAETSFVRIFLTVKDHTGMKTRHTRDIHPQLASLRFDTIPSGNHLYLGDGFHVETPAVVTVWENQDLHILAPDQGPWVFDSWSNGGELEQTITVSTIGENLEYIATYEQVSLMAAPSRSNDFQHIKSVSSASAQEFGMQAEIVGPAKGSEFAVGDVFTLNAEGYDTAGMPLPDSAFTWKVRNYLDSSSSNKLLNSTTGNGIEVGPVPNPTDILATDSGYLEINLVLKDPVSGSITKLSQTMRPRMTSVVFDSVPTGRILHVGGHTIQTPHSLHTWENQLLDVEAPNQDSFVFDRWSDSGSRSHEIISTASSSVFVATFTDSATADFSDTHRLRSV